MKNGIKYHVVRLDHGIVNAAGHYHQTHHFSSHKLLPAAIKSFLRHARKYNCVSIVDNDGKQVKFDYC